jgi:hypothetical protein
MAAIICCPRSNGASVEAKPSRILSQRYIGNTQIYGWQFETTKSYEVGSGETIQQQRREGILGIMDWRLVVANAGIFFISDPSTKDRKQLTLDLPKPRPTPTSLCPRSHQQSSLLFSLRTRHTWRSRAK